MPAPARAHRILSRAAGKPVRAGERVRVKLDRVVLSGAAAPAALARVGREGRPWSSEDLLLTMDFQAPEVEEQTPRSRAMCRELVEKFGLTHVFDLNAGIGSHVILESALVRPGQLAAGSGRCLGVVGGVGALGLRLPPDEVAETVLSGELTVTVPEAVRVTVRGKPARWIGPWDLAVAVRSALGGELAGVVIEFDGEVESWGVDLRLGLCGLLAEMGASAALVAPDEQTAVFFAERGDLDLPEDEAPGDEAYGKAVTMDAGAVSSVVGADYAGEFQPLSREGGEEIQGAFIGSCYGGRYEDLALVAEVLKKAGRVQSGVRLVLSPATLETARAALQAGFYETFLQAGAMVVVPGGGPGSAGGGAIFGEGERIAATAEYHRRLRPGQGTPEVQILSPASAAVAAATGKLMDPAVYLA